MELSETIGALEEQAFLFAGRHQRKWLLELSWSKAGCESDHHEVGILNLQGMEKCRLTVKGIVQGILGLLCVAVQSLGRGIDEDWFNYH